MVPGVTFKASCRGQVAPSSRDMSYELFVRGIEAGDFPSICADVLLTVDGRRAFHGRKLALRLWPEPALAHPAPVVGAVA